MKLIRLAVMDIISFAKEKTMVFVLLAVGMVLSCFCAVYYYSYQKTLESNWIQRVEYYIEFTGPIGSNKIENLIKVLEGVENSPYVPYDLYLLDQNSYDSMDYRITKSSRVRPDEYYTDNDFKYTYPRGIIGINDHSIPNEQSIINGRGLNEQDKKTNGALADIGCEPGDILTFYGYNFEIVGTMDYNYDALLPKYVIVTNEQYINLNLPCKYVIVEFMRTPPQNLIDALSLEATNILQSVKVFEPENLPDSVAKSISDEMFKIIIIVSLSIIYIFALFRYWITDNFKKYAIFTIAGASVKTLQFIVVISAVLFTFAPYIVSVGIFYLLDIVIDLPDITYVPSINEYVLMALLLSVIAVFITLPTIWSLRKAGLHNHIQ